MLTRRTAILAIRETTYGTDPAMTGTNGMLAYDVDFNPSGEILRRDVQRDTLSPMPTVLGLMEQSVTFKTELKGAGVIGTGASVPEFDPLLHACGFASAAITGTSIVYNPVSKEASMGSAALKIYKDGNLHKLVGARGTVKVNLEAGQYGVMEWELSGRYVAVAADTVPDISGLSANVPPIVYNASFQIGGFSPVTTRLLIDIGNEVVRRDNLNATYGVDSFRISGREGKIEFDADAVVESSNPFWGDWAASVINTFEIRLGATAGNKVSLSGLFNIGENKYGDSDGISTYEVSGSLVSSTQDTQNDEVQIKFA